MDIAGLVVTWLLMTLTLLLGYILGSFAKNVSTEIAGGLFRNLKQRLQRKELGAVRTLSKVEMDRANNPRIQEEEAAWDETVGRQIGNTKTESGS